MSARGLIRDSRSELVQVESSAIAVCDKFLKIPEKNILNDSDRSI
jgi:hypothetical protein